MDPLGIGFPSYGCGIEDHVTVTIATATHHLTNEIERLRGDMIDPDDVQQLGNVLEEVRGELRELASHVYQQYNANSGTVALPFKIIRFPNGCRPNEAPYSLPLLHTVDDIRNLNDQHTRLYHKEYRLGSPERHAASNGDIEDVQRKKAEIASYIGYTRPLDV